jgi:hypothetical protein
MTDENRDLGQVAYDAFFTKLKDSHPYRSLPEHIQAEWRAAAEAVAAIAREEGYRAGLDRAAQYHEDQRARFLQLHYDRGYTEAMFRHPISGAETPAFRPGWITQPT